MVEIVSKDVQVWGNGEFVPYEFVQLTLSPKTARFVAGALREWLATTYEFLASNPGLVEDENYMGWDDNDLTLIKYVVGELDEGEKQLQDSWNKRIEATWAETT